MVEVENMEEAKALQIKHLKSEIMRLKIKCKEPITEENLMGNFGEPRSFNITPNKHTISDVPKEGYVKYKVEGAIMTISGISGLPTQRPDHIVEPNKMVFTQSTVKTYTLPDADGVIIPKKEYEKFKEFISSKTTDARENCPWKCKSDAESCLCRSKSPD